VLVLLGKTAALTALLSNLGSDLDSNLPTNANELTAITHASALLPLLIAPLLGRAACSALFLLLPYVRENGIGHSAAQTFNQRLAQTPTQIALLISIALTLLCGQWLMLLIAIIVLLTGIYMMRQRLSGFTGDTAGALVEVVEVMGLIGATL
jgi:adenosylcobinamide-GDP ribazoletransferase